MKWCYSDSAEVELFAHVIMCDSNSGLSRMTVAGPETSGINMVSTQTKDDRNSEWRKRDRGRCQRVCCPTGGHACRSSGGVQAKGAAAGRGRHLVASVRACSAAWVSEGVIIWNELFNHSIHTGKTGTCISTITRKVNL
eukprot:6189457-Pleurochrysis_carterae.AAC.1